MLSRRSRKGSVFEVLMREKGQGEQAGRAVRQGPGCPVQDLAFVLRAKGNHWILDERWFLRRESSKEQCAV